MAHASVIVLYMLNLKFNIYSITVGFSGTAGSWKRSKGHLHLFIQQLSGAFRRSERILEGHNSKFWGE